MRKNNFLLLGLFFLTTTISAQVKVVNLLTENQTNPIGLDVQQPRFSWQLVSEQRNISQTAYEITVSDSKRISMEEWKDHRQINRYRCLMPVLHCNPEKNIPGR